MSEEIQYRLLEPCDEEQVRAMLHEIFFGAEGDPFSTAFKYDCPRETNCFVDSVMPDVLTDGVSVVAVLPDTETVVGVRLSITVSKDNPKDLEVDSDHVDTRKMWITLHVLELLFQGIDIYEKYNVNSYVKFLTLAVHPGYRGRGIAGKLVKMALKVAKDRDLHVAVVVATSSFSRRIFDKLGFETLKEMLYEDCLVDGQRALWDTGGHLSQSLHAKYF